MPTRKRAIAGTPNRDPITDAPGAHPLGVGVGTVAGGAAAGAAAGIAAGPVGAVVGAIAGGLLGGLAGKAVAEDIEPTVEEAYWREHFASRPYVKPGADYARYEVAYRYGWEARAKHGAISFADVEAELATGWKKVRGRARLSWRQALPAVRDAYERDRAAPAEAVVPPTAGRRSLRVSKQAVSERGELELPVARDQDPNERKPSRRGRASATGGKLLVKVRRRPDGRVKK